MQTDYFIYKTHCELVIVSDEVSPDDITHDLGVIPTRFFTKGEQAVSKYSDSIMIKPHNLWALQSTPTVLKKEKISHHVEYLKSVFLDKINLLKKYKEDKRLDVTFWIWIETDDAGIGFSLQEHELEFINTVSNRVTFSVISNTQSQEL